MKKWLIIFFVSIAIIVGSLYAVIATWQREDVRTIGIAKDVDAFIRGYCENTQHLPTAAVLQDRFPALSSKSGWFFYTDDSTWLRVQYPVRWGNKEAIGERRISEFTATVYAYAVDYRCRGAR